MMLTTFSWAVLPIFVDFLWWNVQIFLAHFLLGCFLNITYDSHYSESYVTKLRVFILCMVWKYFLSFCVFFLFFWTMSFKEQRFIMLMKSNLSIKLLWIVLFVLYLRSLCLNQGQKYFLLCFNFSILRKSMWWITGEFLDVMWSMDPTLCLFFAYGYSIVLALFAKTVFFLLTCLYTFVQSHLPINKRLFLGFLFCAIDLCDSYLYQYNTILV